MGSRNEAGQWGLERVSVGLAEQDSVSIVNLNLVDINKRDSGDDHERDSGQPGGFAGREQLC